jgi:hypothetical protein
VVNKQESYNKNFTKIKIFSLFFELAITEVISRISMIENSQNRLTDNPMPPMNTAMFIPSLTIA